MTIDWTKPIQTRDGRSARLLCKDLKGDPDYPVVVAVLDEHGDEDLEHYTTDGRYLVGDDEGYDRDLVNVPTVHERWFGVNQGVLTAWDANPEEGQYRAWGFEDEDAARTLAWDAEAYLCITFEDGLPVSSKIVKSEDRNMTFNIEKFVTAAADLRDIVNDASASLGVVQAACSVLANLLSQVPRTEEAAAAKIVADLGFTVVRTGRAVRVDAPTKLDPGWTIVLLPPEHLASNDDDVYIEQVDEARLAKALKIARHNAFVVSTGREPKPHELADFRLAAAIRGRHDVVSGEL